MSLQAVFDAYNDNNKSLWLLQRDEANLQKVANYNVDSLVQLVSKCYDYVINIL